MKKNKHHIDSVFTVEQILGYIVLSLQNTQSLTMCFINDKAMIPFVVYKRADKS